MRALGPRGDDRVCGAEKRRTGHAGRHRAQKEFKARAKKPNGDAAKEMLALGYPVPYRNSDTPPGYVIRRYPDGREELEPVNLGGTAAVPVG